MKKKKELPVIPEIEFNDILIKTDEDEFEIGQSYEENPAQKLRCKKCNGDQFIVWQWKYFTAIKCPHCQWEYCIHDG